VAVTYNNTSQVAILYIDGTENFRRTMSNGIGYSAYEYVDNWSGITIGNYMEWGGYNPHEGFIDAIAIWSRVLTSTNVSYVYNSGAGRTCSGIDPTPSPTPTRTASPTPTPSVSRTATQVTVQNISGARGIQMVTVNASQISGITWPVNAGYQGIGTTTQRNASYTVGGTLNGNSTGECITITYGGSSQSYTTTGSSGFSFSGVDTWNDIVITYRAGSC
jgi:hypothetical protein